MTPGQTDFDRGNPLFSCLDLKDFYKMSRQNHSCHLTTAKRSNESECWKFFDMRDDLLLLLQPWQVMTSLYITGDQPSASTVYPTLMIFVKV